MLVNHSFDKRFVSLMERLRKQYGEEMFELEGIGEKHLDINRYSKDFFGTKIATADKTIDANANVNDISVLTWENESQKSLKKLNALYVLWKSVMIEFGIKRANKMIEYEINGAIRIHDFHMWLKPYSYNQETPIIIRVNSGDAQNITMKQLFDYYVEFVEVLPDRETIDLTNVHKEINYVDDLPVLDENRHRLPMMNWDADNWKVKDRHHIEILDKNGQWSELKRVLRHKTERDMIVYQTENGDFSYVTDDHPVILEDGSEIEAGKLEIGNKIMSEKISYDFDEHIDVSDDVAYFIGFVIGDGNVGRHSFYKANNNLSDNDVAIMTTKVESAITVYQKNIKNTRIYQVMTNLFDNQLERRKSVEETTDRVTFSSRRFKLLLAKYFNMDYGESSYTKTLPLNVLHWTRQAKEALVAGLIDSEGSVGKGACAGGATIRMKSYATIISLYEVVNSIGLSAWKRVCGEKKFDNLFGVSFEINSRIAELSEKVMKNGYELRQSEYDYTERSNAVQKIFRVSKEQFVNTFNGVKLNEFVYDVTTSSGHFYSGGMIQHNCWASSLSELVLNGMPFYPKIKIGPIKHFDSFINLSLQYVCYASNQIAGALALPDFFIYADFFVRKDFGENWHQDESTVKKVNQLFQNWIYSVNFSWRSNQSPFVNLSVFDMYWLKALFKEHANPDFSSPNFDNVDRLQRMFVAEMVRNLKDNPFTFPVMTAALLMDKETKKMKDDDFFNFVSGTNAKTGLFNFFVDTETSSLSSCCRLRNSIEEANKEYVNSFGAGGLSIGSHRVVTINLPQIAYVAEDWEDFKKLLEYRVNLSQDILDTHRQAIQKLIDGNRLPLYRYNFMNLSRQFSTIGFIGMNECVELLGYDILDKRGSERARNILDIINAMNLKKSKADGHLRNVEQVPGESAAYNLAKKDALQFEDAKYELYSNQYIPLVKKADMVHRIVAQGMYDRDCGGGSILHLNIQEEITQKQVKKLIEYTAKKGVIYFAINYNFSQCSSCDKVYIGKMDKSPCHDAPVKNYLRVVGFLSEVSNWSKERRHEYEQREFYEEVV